MIDQIILRGGTATADKRLDRIVEFDPRSKRYPIRALHAGKKPRSYTWACELYLDQGNKGSCVGNGITHEFAARPAPVKGLNEEFAVKKIYYAAQRTDRFPGGEYPGASPVQGGTSVLAGIKVARETGYFEEYRCALSLDDLILGVGHNGPSVMGLRWFSGMMDVDRKGYVHVTGDIMGGHCILCRAVSVKSKCFTLRNSWGKRWGINGDCYISFDDMGKLMDMMGEAWFFIHRHSNPSI